MQKKVQTAGMLLCLYPFSASRAYIEIRNNLHSMCSGVSCGFSRNKAYVVFQYCWLIQEVGERVLDSPPECK